MAPLHMAHVLTGKAGLEIAEPEVFGRWSLTQVRQPRAISQTKEKEGVDRSSRLGGPGEKKKGKWKHILQALMKLYETEATHAERLTNGN